MLALRLALLLSVSARAADGVAQAVPGYSDPATTDWQRAAWNAVFLHRLAGSPEGKDKTFVESYCAKRDCSALKMPGPLTGTDLAFLKQELAARRDAQTETGGTTWTNANIGNLVKETGGLLENFVQRAPDGPVPDSVKTSAPSSSSGGPSSNGPQPTEIRDPEADRQAALGSINSGGQGTGGGTGGAAANSDPGEAAFAAASKRAAGAGGGSATQELKRGFEAKSDDLKQGPAGGARAAAAGGAPPRGAAPGPARGPQQYAAEGRGPVAAAPSIAAAPPAGGYARAAGSFSTGPLPVGAAPTGASASARSGFAGAGGTPSAGSLGLAASSGAAGATATTPDKKDKPAPDDELSPEEKKELEDIQSLLKEAADSGALDGPAVAEALDRLPGGGSAGMSAVVERITQMLGMAGRELTMTERQEVMELAQRMSLSGVEITGLPPAVAHGTPPSPMRLASRLPRWQRWFYTVRDGELGSAARRRPLAAGLIALAALAVLAVCARSALS